MILLDIHTHHADSTPGQAIISQMPLDFAPIQGCWYAIGIHPWKLNVSLKDEIAALHALVNHQQVVAIGETGYDRLKNFDLTIQQTAFRIHADLADQTGKPLIIHSVRATDLLLADRKQMRPKAPWVIHGFRGNPTEAKQLLNAGFCLSFGEKYHIEALRITPLDRLFLETDESLLDIHLIYNKVSQDLRIETTELEEIVGNNIQRIFFP